MKWPASAGIAPGSASAALAVLVVLAAGCGGGHGSAAWREAVSGEAHAEPHAASSEPVLPEAAGWTAELSVVPLTVDAGDGERGFLVESRASVGERCGQCHGDDVSLEAEGLPERAHWEIVRPHGEAVGVSCDSCHAAGDPARLVAADSGAVGFERAHETCATCHFRQVRDWAGGAHGKQVAAWAGPRVVQPCAACHDPHDPGFPVRPPTTLAPLPGASRGEVER